MTPRTTLARLTDELEALRDKRAAEIQKRIEQLADLRKRIDIELALLVDEVQNIDVPTSHRRRSKFQRPQCGTESGYQWHRKNGPCCEDCKNAHAEHERLKSARRRLQRMAAKGVVA